jgi:predicted transcriptional regulator
MAQSVLEMAKDLVMALVQGGSLPPEEMHKELQKTYASLAELKAKEEIGEGGLGLAYESEKDYARRSGSEPFTDWKKSIKKHEIVCLVCGATFKQLSVKHLKDHGLDARSYRLQFSIPRTQPLSAKETTAMRKEIVQQSRPWEKAPTYRKAQERKTDTSPTAKPSRARKSAATAS